MRTILVVIFLACFFVTTLNASSFYRCQVDGRTIITNVPCGGQDPVTRETQAIDPTSTSNPTHNNLLAISETQRRTILAMILTESGLSCPSVNTTFYQGSDVAGNAYWNAACAGGESYVIQLKNDSQGTRTLTCDEVKTLTGNECFTRFTDSSTKRATTKQTQAAAITRTPLPTYDIQSYCREVSQTSGGGYWLEEGCLDNEKEARRDLQRQNIPAEILNYCIQVTNTVQGAYWLLSGCVDNEIESKNRLGR